MTFPLWYPTFWENTHAHSSSTPPFDPKGQVITMTVYTLMSVVLDLPPDGRLT